MAVTRIHTNQMADGIVTNAKIADATIQGGKLADDITYGSNITVSGNLTVNGTTTTIDTVNTTIDDPILLLGANQTGAGAVDLGIMGERGDDTNVFIGYDESANEFIAVETSSLDSATTIEVSDYSNMHVGGLTAEDNAAVTGSITGGSITTAGTLNADGATTLADLTIDASSTIDMGDNKITNVADPTADQDAVTKGYIDGLLSSGSSGFTISDSEDTPNTSLIGAGDTLTFVPTADETTVIVGTDSVTIGLVDSPTVTGTITGGTLTDGTLSINSGAVTGGTSATFSEAVTAGSFTTAGTLNADGATTLGDVTIDASSTLDMGDNKVTNVTDPTADQDAATKAYVDSQISTGTAGFTISDSEDTPNTSVVSTGDTLTFVPTANETTVIVGTDSVTIGLPDDVTINGNLEVEGNITVNGTTTTVNSTVTAVVDPILQLGRGENNAALTSDDAKDRGVSMYYHEGTEKLAFMGFDTTSNDFRYYSEASITDEVVTGTLGSGVFGALTVDDVTIDGRQVTSNDANGNLEIAANGTGKVVLPTGNELVVTDLDDTGIVFSSSGQLTTDSNFTYDGTDIGLGGDFTVVNLTATGTITGDTITDGTLTITNGSITDAVNITATGEITGGSVTVGDLTAGRVVYAGTGGDLSDEAGFEYNATTNTLLAGNIATPGIVTGGTLTDGTISINGGAITGATDLTLTGTLTAGTVTDGTASLTAGAWTGITTLATTGEATLASATVSDLTENRITIAGTDGALEDDANLTWNGTTMLIGTATATTGATLKVSATDSLMVPVGTTAERPTGVAGMMRYNSTLDQYEAYDVSEGEFTALGAPEFTVIASETFDGDGSTVAFTLSDDQTTASCIVSVNGVVQLPTTAYAVSGTTLTFTEAPATADKIEVRKLTTTTTITGGDIEEAPIDGKQYARQDGDWSEVNAGGTVADGCIYLNNQTIENDYTIPVGMNGMSAGAIEFNGTVTVPEGSAYHVVDSTPPTAPKVVNLSANRNLLINGNMQTSQRHKTDAVTTTADGQYGLDRWVGRTFAGAGAFSMQQVTDAPEGFEYSNEITVTTAATSGEGGYGIEQRIEGTNLTMLNYGTADAKSLTASFWIKASVVGTYSVSLRTSTGGVTGISTCKNTFTISVANTWQKVTNTFPANTAYDTIYNSTTGIFFDINFGAQTEKATNTLNSWEPGNFLYATGQTDVMQTLGATINITGVQLEVGEEATPFEHVPYDVNLQRCQRYCEVYDRNSSLCTSLAWTSANTSGPFLYKQKKRGIPTIIPSSLTAFTATAAGGGALPSTNVTAFNTNVDSMELQVIVEAGSLIPGHASILRVGDGTLTIDAEL